MKVYILDNGFLECDLNWMVAMSVHGTRDDPTPRTKWIQIPVYSVLIDHPDGRILYDTGCHPDAMTGHWPNGMQSVFPYHHETTQRLISQLALVDMTPDDIKTVVLSHLHLDHAGNIDLFPHADIYVPKEDFEYADKLVHRSINPGEHGAYIKAEIEATPRGVHLIEKDTELAPGVHMITLRGHTPGLIGLIVELPNEGTLIFPQDAIYTQTNYGPPAKASGLMYDSVAYFESIEKVRELEKTLNARVIFPHDMAFFRTLKLAPAYYD
ncbi:MAG: N-acyl homoserine lactonase family protein [Methylotetracoccus sp.]